MYKASVCTAHNQPFEIQHRSMPQAPVKGLVLKVKACGLCHSDLHVYQNVFHLDEDTTNPLSDFNKEFKLPVVLGHEIAGEVVEVGKEGSAEIKVGDRVVVYPWGGCTTCSNCITGHDNFCTRSMVICYGAGRDGGFQEYMSMEDSSRVVKLPPSIAMDTGCLLGCGALTSYHALMRLKATVEKRVEIHGSANIVIVGAGGLGLWAQKLARYVLPKTAQIFVADISEDKLEVARKSGADGTILWDPSYTEDEKVAKTKEATVGNVDGGIDFVGHSTTMKHLYDVSNTGSTVVCVGLTGGVLKISTTRALYKNINISFLYVGALNQLKDLVAIVDKHKISPPPITHYNLEVLDGLMNKLAERKIEGRAVISFK